METSSSWLSAIQQIYGLLYCSRCHKILGAVLRSDGTDQHPELQPGQQRRSTSTPSWSPRTNWPERLPSRRRPVGHHRQLHVAGARGRHDGCLPVGDRGAAGRTHQPHPDEFRRRQVVRVVQRVRGRRRADRVPRHRLLPPASVRIGQLLKPSHAKPWLLILQLIFLPYLLRTMLSVLFVPRIRRFSSGFLPKLILVHVLLFCCFVCLEFITLSSQGYYCIFL